MKKCIIVAVAENLAIGRDNALLWHLSEDLKYFKKVTMGCPVIMGRRTLESIGRALPGRLNIVITRDSSRLEACAQFRSSEKLVYVDSLEKAYQVASESLSTVEDGRCFVLGGGQVYAQAIGDADKLYVTKVCVKIDDADTFFPQIDSSVWDLDECSELLFDPASGLNFRFETFLRR